MSLKDELVYIDPKIEEDMPEADEHSTLARYLVGLMRWLYRERDWFVSDNLQISQRTETITQDIDPDIAVFKGVTKPVRGPNERLKSWRMGAPNRPAPAVVFEIASESTWPQDLDEKIIRYGRLGVREYFTYDPYVPPYWGTNNRRLRGWRYVEGLAISLAANSNGWIWSEELEAFLVPNVKFLRLYDATGQHYLGRAETERANRLAREQTARKMAEQQAQEAAAARIESEYQARLEATKLAQEAVAHAESERQARLVATELAQEAVARLESERQARLEAAARVESEHQARLEAEQLVRELRAQLGDLKGKD
jgi:Uma2 family endonuclease